MVPRKKRQARGCLGGEGRQSKKAKARARHGEIKIGGNLFIGMPPEAGQGGIKFGGDLLEVHPREAGKDVGRRLWETI